jgi:hypothetical protein
VLNRYFSQVLFLVVRRPQIAESFSPSGREWEKDKRLLLEEAEERSRRKWFRLSLGEGEDESFSEANRAGDFIVESLFKLRTPIRAVPRSALRSGGVSARTHTVAVSSEIVPDTACEPTGLVPQR